MTQSARPGQLDSIGWHVCVKNWLTDGCESVGHGHGWVDERATASIYVDHAQTVNSQWLTGRTSYIALAALTYVGT